MFATKSHVSTGLGLFISKYYRSSYGRIWAENNVDGKEKGAAFSFSIPIN